MLTNTRVHSDFVERVKRSLEEFGLFLVHTMHTHLLCSFPVQRARSLDDQERCKASRTPSHSAVSSTLKDRSTRGGEKTWPPVSGAPTRVAARAPPSGASGAPSDLCYTVASAAVSEDIQSVASEPFPHVDRSCSACLHIAVATEQASSTETGCLQSLVACMHYPVRKQLATAAGNTQ